MKRFGLPVSAVTMAIVVTSLISWFDATNSYSLNASTNESYISAAESNMAKSSKDIEVARDMVLVIPLQSSQNVDGSTVTSKMDQPPFKISEENIFIFILFGVSLFFMVTGFRRTIRGASTKNSD
jgi:hypothetical protein